MGRISSKLDRCKGAFSASAPGTFIRHYTILTNLKSNCVCFTQWDRCRDFTWLSASWNAYTNTISWNTSAIVVVYFGEAYITLISEQLVLIRFRASWNPYANPATLKYCIVLKECACLYEHNSNFRLSSAVTQSILNLCNVYCLWNFLDLKLWYLEIHAVTVSTRISAQCISDQVDVKQGDGRNTETWCTLSYIITGGCGLMWGERPSRVDTVISLKLVRYRVQPACFLRRVYMVQYGIASIDCSHWSLPFI